MTPVDTADTAALEALPNHPAVFVLWPREGRPHLSKTAVLRRRVLRLFKAWNLAGTVDRIEYRLTGSAFESAVVHYEQARRLYPETYLQTIKLRLPPYVKVVLSNEFPRSHISTHLTRSGAMYFGPFGSRTAAERFEGQCLDLFQMRRCQEDLVPSPSHPGCIYGEMAMCLRPCQQVVGAPEYAHEVARVVEFLRTDGRSLLDAISRSRDRLSEEMMFEDAARQHKRYEKVVEVLKLRDELARDVDRLHGVAITRSIAQECVDLWFVRDGYWQEPQRFSFEADARTISLDRKLRDAFALVAARKCGVREREEYLALLARWYYSTWRDGEWIGFESFDDIPYRKLVNAISRVARREGPL